VVRSRLLALFWIASTPLSDADRHPIMAGSFINSVILPPHPRQSYQICMDLQSYFSALKVTFHWMKAAAIGLT
jgi:hypothetical protein